MIWPALAAAPMAERSDALQAPRIGRMQASASTARSERVMVGAFGGMRGGPGRLGFQDRSAAPKHATATISAAMTITVRMRWTTCQP